MECSVTQVENLAPTDIKSNIYQPKSLNYFMKYVLKIEQSEQQIENDLTCSLEIWSLIKH